MQWNLVPALLLLAVPAVAEAEVYKCTIDGNIIYSDDPCPAGAESKIIDLEPPSVIPDNNPSLSRYPQSRQQQGKLTMSASDAIVVERSSCTNKGRYTIHSGLLRNISRYSTYSAKMTTQFVLESPLSDFTMDWGKQTKTTRLGPGQTWSFKLQSRVHDDGDETSCDYRLKVKFIDSVLKQ
ncbi:DUF4124 domain-containing protein [Ferrimonas balearica]|uniref:DUF4124 domain-containing protein n=1 Tax=Ferrimonas balearica TaxID=44012 RepID=UPI001C98F9AF|nr:DUF4124 domain-containing protein [Ferrimonas balearica]MBY5992840.1 DUF4124 domain-containing protein [Ferrimonas balearica]